MAMASLDRVIFRKKSTIVKQVVNNFWMLVLNT